MDPILTPAVFVFGVLTCIGIVVVLCRLGYLQDSMLQIVTSPDAVVTVHEAMTPLKYSKSELEQYLYELAKAATNDPKMQNLSRDDIRSVMKLQGVVFDDHSPGELVAQAREMPNW